MYSHVVQRSIHTNCIQTNHEISILDSDASLHSVLFILTDNCNLHTLSFYLVSKLIKLPVDSINGISIVAQQTRFRFVGLNSTRPAVMQMSFVTDVGKKTIMSREPLMDMEYINKLSLTILNE